MKCVVTGAGGFIGHHLVEALTRQGHDVIGVDLHAPQFASSPGERFVVHDCRDADVLESLLAGADQLYALAADMGGMGFISANHTTIMRNNTLINLSTLEAARRARVGSVIFTSSACVYPVGLQATEHPPALTEEMALPARPEGGYGWEKLYAEQLYAQYRHELGLETRIARLHNVYGPRGAWRGGREKAPAALCRKVAEAVQSGSSEIEVWGDGRQVRSFLYVDDCIDGLIRLASSDLAEPVNLGKNDPISIDALAALVMRIAGVELTIVHRDGPQGVRARNADETRARKALGWCPRVGLEEGMGITYGWIAEQVQRCRER